MIKDSNNLPSEKNVVPSVISPRAREWNTNILSVYNDQEVCWWAFWCFPLLHLRNEHMLQRKWPAISILLLSIVGLISTIVIMFQLGIIMGLYFGFFMSLLIAILRARGRTTLRQTLNIQGSYFKDILFHIFIPCCSICQESRQLKNESPMLDFITGEEIFKVHSIFQSHQSGIETIENGADTFTAHFQIISQLSKCIIYLFSFLLIIAIAVLVSFGLLKEIVMIFGIFTQPIIILYLFYWRSRRNFASLDYVIKLFAVGFFITTLQAVVIEFILQSIFALIFTPYLISETTSSSSASVITPSSSQMASIGLLLSPWRSLTQRSMWSGFVANDANFAEDDFSASFRASLLQNMAAPVTLIFLVSFVVAAGVEETLKYFAVRGCYFYSPLRSPSTIMVYLLSGALGFATAENILYVFGSGGPLLPGASPWVGEALVLLVRICVPLHAVCALVQANSMARAVLRKDRFSLLFILLPAITLHGNFDFTLFLCGLLDFVYKLDTFMLDLIAFVLVTLMTFLAAVWSLCSFAAVESKTNVQSASSYEMVDATELNDISQRSERSVAR